jgi:hypothetical protein
LTGTCNRRRSGALARRTWLELASKGNAAAADNATWPQATPVSSGSRGRSTDRDGDAEGSSVSWLQRQVGKAHAASWIAAFPVGDERDGSGRAARRCSPRAESDSNGAEAICGSSGSVDAA